MVVRTHYPFAVAIILLLSKVSHAWLASKAGRATTRRSFSRLQQQGTAAQPNLLSLETCLELYEQSIVSNVSTNNNATSNVKFIEASWYHKGQANGRQDFEQGPRIPGSGYFDMSDIVTSQELFPNSNPRGLYLMLPTSQLFASAMDAMAIRETDHVVIIGRGDSRFTPRVWFTFRAMGHARGAVSLMQASLEEWITAGGPVESDAAVVMRAKDLDLNQPPSYRVSDDSESVIQLDKLMRLVDANTDAAVGEDDTIIVDARGSSFSKKGYIPGAIHIPYSSLAEPTNPLRLKPTNELRAIFQAAGVDPATDKRIVCSCGSGVSACSLYLALEECGRIGETVMYDGSWNEWGSHPKTPKVLPMPPTR